jgi:hypothetical protein
VLWSVIFTLDNGKGRRRGAIGQPFHIQQQGSNSAGILKGPALVLDNVEIKKAVTF